MCNGQCGIRASWARRVSAISLAVVSFAFPAAAAAQETGAGFQSPDSGSRWRGAAFSGEPAALAHLARAGAEVVRVYHASDTRLLDEARKLGMRVVVGLPVGHPRHGFRLDDAHALQAQERAIRASVERLRDHPAVLAWAIGNEVETAEADPLPAWREVNRLAGLVKALDPAHRTLMVVADTGMARLKLLADCCANVDLLGINVYGGAAFDLPQRLRNAGIAKPVVVTELGPLGQWQAGRKPWGAPVELTSSQKAAFFRDALAFLDRQPQIAGVFPFLWGAKQEQTATWHGLLLADGSATAMTDSIASAWGARIADPAPQIRGIGIAADQFAPRAPISAGVDAAAFDGSPLRAEWEVLAEATDLRVGGDPEAAPARIPVEVVHADAKGARIIAPERPGAYRLFVTLRDRNGKAATANLPFLVQ